MCFSGQTEDYPIWSTRFAAFAQTKGWYETLVDSEQVPTRPAALATGSTAEQATAHQTAVDDYNKKVNEMKKRKNDLWCYLAMTLDSNSLMLIRHDCVDDVGKGDGQKAWTLLQQRFRSDDTPTVVSVMRQLARLQLKEDEDLFQYSTRAQELISRLEHAGETLSEMLFNAMLQTGYLSDTNNSLCKKGSTQLDLLWN